MTASPTSRHYVLEPIRPVLIGVSLGHLALSSIIIWFASSNSTPSRQPSPTSVDASSSLHWFRPADFQAPSPFSTSASTPEISHQPLSTRNASRYITLSRVTTPSTAPLPQSSNPSLPSPFPNAAPDATTMSELDRIDEALYEAFMQAWSPPDHEQLAPSKRITRLDISLTPELALVQADLVHPSGSTDLDLSVLLAAEKVAERLRNRLTSSDSLKIPKTLPSSFQNSRYVCRIQFQIE